MGRLITSGHSLKQFSFRFPVFLIALSGISADFLLFSLRFLKLIVWRGILTNFLWEHLVLGLYLGFGERPGRILVVALVISLGLALGYWQAGTFVIDMDPEARTLITGRPTLLQAIYYSAISVTALGYGNWAPEPLGWAKWVGAGQPVFGTLSFVFFSMTFAQRITR